MYTKSDGEGDVYKNGECDVFHVVLSGTLEKGPLGMIRHPLKYGIGLVQG